MSGETKEEYEVKKDEKKDDPYGNKKDDEAYKIIPKLDGGVEQKRKIKLKTKLEKVYSTGGE